MRFASAAAALAAIASLAALVPATAVADGPQARASIVGGSSARAGAYPWMVALSRGCGATLIAPDRVLTAGHCVEELRAEDLKLYVGARQRERGRIRYDGRAVTAVEVASHPGYRSLSGGAPVNDAAIIKLSAPITDVPLARLAGPGDGRLFGGGRPATVIGWGVTRTDLRDPPLARSLRQGGLRVLSDRTCNRVYGTDGSYRRSVMVCARSRNRSRRPQTSPCIGDSGGPLVARGGLQVGIVSFGISCGALREPTVFAQVSALRPFIDNPTPVWAPQPLDRPAISGTASPGEAVTCETPPFRNPVTRVRYRWGVDGLLVATGRRVRVTGAAAGRELQCRVVAENEGGATPSRPSAAVRVSG